MSGTRTKSEVPVGTAGRPGFGARLLTAQTLVLVASAVTCWTVASAVGPNIFRDHLRRAGVSHSATEEAHVADAFASALLVSVLIALAAAVIMAFAVTWYFSRRMQGSIAAVAESASDVAAGRFTTRIPLPGLGSEFDQLAATFNQLAERLDSVETTRRRMLADLGHEMRTPLANLDAHLEALEDGVRTLDESTFLVLRSSTDRLRRLAQDISTLSQAQEGTVEIKRTLMSTRDLTHTAIQSARDGYLAKGVALVEGNVSDATISVDPERMGQVLGNLLDNALRHTPAGGRVAVTSRSVDRWIEIAVEDSGAGIEAEHLSQVFDRFYRADTARNHHQGGSGIGLTISKALVESHGGRITAHSEGSGTGATFLVRIPRMVR